MRSTKWVNEINLKFRGLTRFGRKWSRWKAARMRAWFQVPRRSEIDCCWNCGLWPDAEGLAILNRDGGYNWSKTWWKVRGTSTKFSTIRKICSQKFRHFDFFAPFFALFLRSSTDHMDQKTLPWRSKAQSNKNSKFYPCFRRKVQFLILAVEKVFLRSA